MEINKAKEVHERAKAALIEVLIALDKPKTSDKIAQETREKTGVALPTAYKALREAVASGKIAEYGVKFITIGKARLFYKEGMTLG